MLYIHNSKVGDSMDEIEKTEKTGPIFLEVQKKLEGLGETYDRELSNIQPKRGCDIF